MASAVFFLDLKGKVYLLRLDIYVVLEELTYRDRPFLPETTEVIFPCRLSRNSPYS